MRFVFFDRDGTLIKLYDYLGDPALVELLPSVVEGLKLLLSHNLALAVVTNQSGVGRGMYSLADMHACNNRLAQILLTHDIPLHGIYACPHGPKEGCACRKPLPGMIQQAQATHTFDPAQSFVVGDNDSDLALARNIHAKAILVTTGHGAQTLAKPHTKPDFIAPDILTSAQWIVANL
jgi:D-glycero-D-manno-heptose 1,7-bisphosphate phosphatase